MRALLLFFLLFPSIYSIGCPSGFILVGGEKCLKPFWEPANHWEAEKNCTAVSGTLVIIRNAIDNRIVSTFANDAGMKQIRIGLSCFGINSTSCFWDDGSGTLVYNNSLALPVGLLNLGFGCVIMSTLASYPDFGKWYLNSCNFAFSTNPYLLPYICETPTLKITTAGYKQYDDASYVPSITYFFPSSLNMTQAKRKCIGYGNMISIHSKMEVDYIRNLYKDTNATTIYLGAEADESGRFNWLDGSNWDFDYMDPLNFTRGKCLVMDVKGYGLWSQVDCDKSFTFICKRIVTTTTSVKAIAPEAGQEQSQSNQLFDASNCNSTLYMAPGSISSFGYPDYTSPPSYCTWQLAALGPYQLGIYIDFWATNGKLTMFDENGANIGEFVGTYDRTPFVKYALYNIAKVTFEPRPGVNVDRGFHAVILPL